MAKKRHLRLVPGARPLRAGSGGPSNGKPNRPAVTGDTQPGTLTARSGEKDQCGVCGAWVAVEDTVLDVEVGMSCACHYGDDE
jgi:hypothetical protein